MAMHQPKWAIFFDFHTMPACPDVGAAFDADAVTDHLKSCGVDYICFPARCNLGTAYYNTRVGIRHPALTYDMFGALAQACHEREIALTAYINVGLSHEEALRHREWCVLTPEGHTYQPDRLSHFFRQMCYNTGYAAHVEEMVREVAGGYPVSGFFFDCIYTSPCVGVECIEQMRERGIDWEDPEQLHRWNWEKQVAMARRLADAAKAIRPDLLIYCNGVDYEAQHDIGTYLEFECLPTGGWGYETLPVGARYLRTLGKPVLNMTGRFHKSWGDFGGIRTQPSLEYDCLYGMANAMRTTIGDHFHPRGDINRAVFDTYRRVYQRLQRFEPWLEGAQAVTEAAIVWPTPYPGYKFRAPGQWERYLRFWSAIRGACRMLCELKWQFDIVTTFSDWGKYRLLILPDFVELDDEIAARVRAHLDAGGVVLSTGWSGLDPARTGFVFDEWGLEYVGDDPYDPAFFRPTSQVAEGLPEMPVALYQRGAAVEPLEGTQVLAEIIAPYYNRHWDGEHGFVYLPPDRPTGRAAATRRGAVAHITHPVFTSYFIDAQVPIKQLVANVLALLMPDPLVRAPGLPSFARATVTEQPGRRMVHLLAYVPERRGERVDMIEEPIELRDVELALRAGGALPSKVYLAPDREALELQVREGYIHTTVPLMRGHAMVVFEQ
ncbi:MAG: beta-galactosidase trimerization domain-containing protein [Armatimonadota bacterium]